MEIRKAASAAPCGEPTPGQLEAINTLSRGALKAEDVYVFSVRLCDDQPDRDYERFDTCALPRLAELFRGKTGVTDHNWSAEKQVARIFDTEVVQEGTVTYLKAWCYCLRTEEALIAQIDGGIRKEVSVGCAMGKRTCSVCGSPYGSCSHRKGQRYEDQVCLAVLSEPTDAYEFSFVAVPAQRESGVSKGFSEPKSEEQERLAALGREYLTLLRREVERLAFSLELDMDEAALKGMTGKLEPEELKAIRDALARKHRTKYPGTVQLTPDNRREITGIEPEYRI